MRWGKAKGALSDAQTGDAGCYPSGPAATRTRLGDNEVRSEYAATWAPVSFRRLRELATPNRLRSARFRFHERRSGSLSGVETPNETHPGVGDKSMTTGLAERLEEIAGVESVVVDLTESGGGINVKLESGANEVQVMDKLRSILVAYGVRAPSPPKIRPSPTRRAAKPDPGVDVTITPIKGGARVEVETRNIRSFRVVAPTPTAIAQGIADAWCQVVGQVPVEIVKVKREDDGSVTVVAFNGVKEAKATQNLASGWQDALAAAVGAAIEPFRQPKEAAPMAINS